MMPIGGFPVGIIHALSSHDISMRSPVSKLVQLKVAQYILDPTEPTSEMIMLDSEQEAYAPLREYPQLCHAFVKALHLELLCLEAVADKGRKSVLVSAKNQGHRSNVMQRDLAIENYEVLRRLICPDDTHLQIIPVRYVYL